MPDTKPGPAPQPAQIPKTVLVVDDSMLIRHAVCRFLESRGCHVHAATNGAEALSVLEYFIPDVIITDLDMPQISGADLISKIRANPVFANTPIVILAARSHAAKLSSELLSGISAVVYKNIEIEEQLARVLNFTLS
jgi:two-component system chemotaxis response regulator CheY